MGIKKGTKLDLGKGPRYSYRRSKWRDFYLRLLQLQIELRVPFPVSERNGHSALHTSARKYLPRGVRIAVRKEYEANGVGWYITIAGERES